MYTEHIYLINILDRWSSNMQGCEFALSHFRSLFIRSYSLFKKEWRERFARSKEQGERMSSVSKEWREWFTLNEIVIRFKFVLFTMLFPFLFPKKGRNALHRSSCSMLKMAFAQSLFTKRVTRATVLYLHFEKSESHFSSFVLKKRAIQFAQKPKSEFPTLAKWYTFLTVEATLHSIYIYTVCILCFFNMLYNLYP